MSLANTTGYTKNGQTVRNKRVSNSGSGSRDRLHQSALAHYFTNHVWALLATLGQFTRHPLSSILTALVIGVALALPAGLYLMLDNARQLTGAWDDSLRVSVFLQADLKTASQLGLKEKITQLEQVSNVELISSEQALAEFQQYSGLGEALGLLDENPLPTTLLVTPAREDFSPARVEGLVDKLKGFSGVEKVQMDMQWVNRLNGLLDVGQRSLILFGAFLGLAILIIIGNTIRLIIQNQRQEIVVTKLIGGTDAFIRRPFLYWGLWFGLTGGVIAVILVTVTVWSLSNPVQHLADLYHTQFTLSGIGVISSLVIMGTGMMLGLCGAWLSVGRHLRDIEPQ